MPKPIVFCLVTLALISFAGNSLICRQALRSFDEMPSSIDANSFTLIRIFSGAVALVCIATLSRWLSSQPKDKSLTNDVDTSANRRWQSIGGPISLLAYAVGFSFAYLKLSAATGALLLFGSVQLTMIFVALFRGERITRFQTIGFGLAVIGFVALLLPSSDVPSTSAAFSMVMSGVGWGCYSVLGKGANNPISMTARNFTFAVPFALICWLCFSSSAHATATGITLAILSGAITSGLGYSIWYRALPEMTSLSAASVQLSVPVLVAAGGILILGEPVRLSLILCSAAVLSGVVIYLLAKPKPNRI